MGLRFLLGLLMIVLGTAALVFSLGAALISLPQFTHTVLIIVAIGGVTCLVIGGVLLYQATSWLH